MATALFSAYILMKLIIIMSALYRPFGMKMIKSAGLRHQLKLSKLKRCFRHMAIDREAVATTKPFWREGLRFECTGCGRCCQNEGEVWFDSEEFVDLVRSLRLPPADVLNTYVELVMNGWIKMKSKSQLNSSVSPISSVPRSIQGELKDQCIFLSEDGRKCSIYEVRPLQCRTYPYWPRILSDKQEWDKEAVLPEELPGRHWTPTDGGCEGINHSEAPLVPATTIYRNKELYTMYNGLFPFMVLGDDKNRLLNRVDVMLVVT